jgi:hypothetical protein
MFLTVDVLEVDFLVVDVLELDVLGARLTDQLRLETHNTGPGKG